MKEIANWVYEPFFPFEAKSVRFTWVTRDQGLLHVRPRMHVLQGLVNCFYSLIIIMAILT